tara:strand:+ start:717 stop:1262 length:546 start_codon:yes stop_codon:yes gene_type:complete
MNMTRRALGIGKRFLKAGVTGLAGRDDGSGSALMAAMLANDAINAVRGSTAAQRNKPQQQGPKPKQETKPKKRNYQTAKQFAESKNPRYKPGNVVRRSNGSGSKPAQTKPGTRQNVTPKPKVKPKPKPKAKPKTAQQRAYAADARNKKYDELRRAGKIKEATALAKKIAADAAARRKKKKS